MCAPSPPIGPIKDVICVHECHITTVVHTGVCMIPVHILATPARFTLVHAASTIKAA